MNYVSIGDLALSFQSRRDNVRIRTDLERLSQELSSGHRADLGAGTSGDLLPIAGLEHAMRSANAYSTVIAEAALISDTMQRSLEMVQANSSDLGPALLAASSSEHPMLIESTATDARLKFEAVLSAFNTRVADRYAFSGTTTDSPAFADADTILTSLQTAIAGQTTAAGIQAAVDTWFDTSGGGFETDAYIGSTTRLAPLHLSENDTVQLDALGSDTDVREVLKGFAMAALIDDGALSGDVPELAALSRIAGEQILTAEYNLSGLRSRIGSAEARIDSIGEQNAAQKIAFEVARSELTAVDPYRTATELEAVRAQLETFYTVTARLSNLSLSEYLR